MAPHLRAYCQSIPQSPRQGMEIMRSRGVGCGEREQVEAIRRTPRLGAVAGAWWRRRAGVRVWAGSWETAGVGPVATASIRADSAKIRPPGATWPNTSLGIPGGYGGDGRISLASLPTVAEFSGPVPASTSPAGGGYRAQRHQLLQSPAEGAHRDLWPDALAYLRSHGVGIACHVLHDEGTKTVRFDPFERCLLIEARVAQQARRHMVARAARAPRLHYQAWPVKQANLVKPARGRCDSPGAPRVAKRRGRDAARRSADDGTRRAGIPSNSL